MPSRSSTIRHMDTCSRVLCTRKLQTTLTTAFQYVAGCLEQSIVAMACSDAKQADEHQRVSRLLTRAQEKRRRNWLFITPQRRDRMRAGAKRAKQKVLHPLADSPTESVTTLPEPETSSAVRLNWLQAAFSSYCVPLVQIRHQNTRSHAQVQTHLAVPCRSER